MMQQDQEPQPSNKRKVMEPPLHMPRATPTPIAQVTGAHNAHMRPIPNSQAAPAMTAHTGPAPGGPHFFLKEFMSPEMMPKKGAVPSLDYLVSPTPSRTTDTVPLLVPEPVTGMQPPTPQLCRCQTPWKFLTLWSSRKALAPQCMHQCKVPSPPPKQQ